MNKEMNETKMKLLDYLDELLYSFYLKEGKWPNEIICSSELKKKILKLFQEDLHCLADDDKTWQFDDTYRGISFKIDETEPFIRLQ